MKKNIEELLKMTDGDLYGHYNEGEPEQASQNVRDTYHQMNMAEENYIAAVSEQCFAEGFRYAISLRKEGAGAGM